MPARCSSQPVAMTCDSSKATGRLSPRSLLGGPGVCGQVWAKAVYAFDSRLSKPWPLTGHPGAWP
eukprot:9623182-Lingulodinium_polyedra.AAC.1